MKMRMFAPTKGWRFTFTQAFRPHTSIHRNVSSAAFSKMMSVPFTTDKAKAIELFKTHHAKHLLLQQPVATPPEPIPIYLPYYIFSATANLTYSARLSKTTYELRYDLFGGRWRYYPRTRINEIPQQTLSSKDYPSDHVPLHIYAAYDQLASWLKFDTSKIVSLMSNRPLTSISGIIPRVEEFSRPYKGVEDQVMKYLVDAEQERARKYLQRTYDPENIEFTFSQCHASLNSQQVYIPVWKFEFPFDGSDGKYSTYVSGWDTSTSGPVFYHAGLSGVVAGVLSALASIAVLWPWNLVAATGMGGVVFVLVRQYLSSLPRSQRLNAWSETTQQRIQDNAAAQQGTRQESTYDWGYTGRQQQQQQQRQQQSQQQRQRPTQTTTKYPTNDPQGLYKTLEVTPTATDSEIRDSFRRLARKYHPDMIQGSTAEKNAGKEKFQQISAAYDVLKDPRRRKEYNTYGTTSTRN